MSLRDKLRELAPFAATLPPFEVADAAAEPVTQFLQWLDEAIAAGQQAPHVMTLSTSSTAGVVTARNLIIKDIDERGWQFGTSLASGKAEDLAENPNAALSFWWPVLGRQVRVVGPAMRLSAEEAAADFLARPSAAGRPVDPDWALFAVNAAHVEFFQARHDRVHTRLLYERAGEQWATRLLAP
jgi:pyridoxamine 5'-phosphate oxidase